MATKMGFIAPGGIGDYYAILPEMREINVLLQTLVGFLVFPKKS
jgi:hypothetical protein